MEYWCTLGGMQHVVARFGVLFLSLLILCAFTTGGTVHSLVHHEHHGSDVIWSGLHGALSHEGKKLYIDVVVVWFATTLYLFLRFFSTFVIARIRAFRNALRPSELDTMLRRGCLPYRAFG